jgi:hypothetical protein
LCVVLLCCVCFYTLHLAQYIQYHLVMNIKVNTLRRMRNAELTSQGEMRKALLFFLTKFILSQSFHGSAGIAVVTHNSAGEISFFLNSKLLSSLIFIHTTHNKHNTQQTQHTTNTTHNSIVDRWPLLSSS